jgi:nicotinamidase-related amidase
MRRGMRGREIAQRLAPSAQDYSVLKPKHSGFYMTPLSLLLESLGVRRLILTGLLADSCVVFTANDAYLRGYRLCVPSDCVASMRPEHVQQALSYMQRTLKAEVDPAQSLRFDSKKR